MFNSNITIWICVAVTCFLATGLFVINEIEANTGITIINSDPDGDGFEKWAVLSSEYCGSELGRYHIISPEREWYIIPDTYKPLFNKVKEGDVVTLPSTVRSWCQPVDALSGNDHSREYLNGSMIKHGKDSYTTGIYFFVEVK